MSVPLPPMKDINAYSVPLCAGVWDLLFDLTVEFQETWTLERVLQLKDHGDF